MWSAVPSSAPLFLVSSTTFSNSNNSSSSGNALQNREEVDELGGGLEGAGRRSVCVGRGARGVQNALITHHGAQHLEQSAPTTTPQ
uniref:Putative secreted protein n=1 Tax=Anopheles darlingi TaxID=43151 RepID=A0A2M4D3E3_ANODA